VIAVVNLTAGVVVFATHDDSGAASVAPTQVSTPAPTGSTRYDGGPEEDSRGALSAGAPSNEAPGTRCDGGPEQGQ
jgi:hypothetical protein